MASASKRLVGARYVERRGLA